MKNNRGITLIALVVTIIILLILAGISIAMFTGDGIFSRATLGARSYDEAQKAENSVIEGWIEGYDNAYQGQQVVAPTIEIVGEEKPVYGGNVQVKITANNPNVLKDAHYLVEGAEAKGDTVIADKTSTTITISTPGITTVKAWAIGYNNQTSEYASKTITINSAPPAQATITVSGPKSATALPQTLTATITHTSEYNDINISNCKYVINNSSENLGTDPSSYINTFTSNGQEIEIPINATGNYYLHVLSSNQSTTRVETIKTITASANTHQHVQANGTKGTSEYVTTNGGCYTKKWYSATKKVENYHAATTTKCGGRVTWRITAGPTSDGRGGYKYNGVLTCNKCGAHNYTNVYLSQVPGQDGNCPFNKTVAAYWSTDSNGTVTGWGNVPANSSTSSQKITYSGASYRYYANCGKTVGSTIDSYTISY